MRKSLVLGIGTFQPGARSSPTVDFKLRKLDPARFKETGGIASDGVLKEVAGVACRRRLDGWGTERRTECQDGDFGNTGLVRKTREGGKG